MKKGVISMEKKHVYLVVYQKLDTESERFYWTVDSVWASREEATRHVEEDKLGHRVKEVEFGQILPIINDDNWVES